MPKWVQERLKGPVLSRTPFIQPYKIGKIQHQQQQQQNNRKETSKKN